MNEKIENLVALVLSEKIATLKELINTQRKAINGELYHIGVYNGLVLALSVLTNEAPVYYEAESEGKEDGEKNVEKI